MLIKLLIISICLLVSTFSLARPFAEFEPVKTLFLPIKNSFGSKELVKKIINEVPSEVEIVLINQKTNYEEINFFARELNRSVKLINFTNFRGDSFWLRDSMPIPLVSPKIELSFLDAKAGAYFEGDKEIASLFNSEVKQIDNFFDGGNLIADSKGNCFIVNNNLEKYISDDDFINKFECNTITRLNYETGIGHIDEKIKFVSDNIVLTDSLNYKKILEKKGYKVFLLPRGSTSNENYLNSLIINDKVFVPIFGRDDDKKVLEIYKNFFNKVIPIQAYELINSGLGALHCISLTLPHKINSPSDNITFSGSAHDEYPENAYENE